MRLLSGLLLLVWLGMGMPGLRAQADWQSRPVSLAQTEGTVAELLAALEKALGIPLAYSPERVQASRRVQLRGDEKTLGDYLQALFPDQQVQLRQRGNKLLLLPEPPRFTFSGYVREAESGEALISAAVMVPGLQVGVYTNAYGFFSLTLPAGRHRVRIAYLGFGEKWLSLDLQEDRFEAVGLTADFSLKEIEIVETAEAQRLPALSRAELTAEELAALPNLLGQQDLLKNIQLLPGVQSMSDGVNGLAVRGGSPDQNLILLDEVPIYNPSHSLGLFSVFYGDAIQKVQVMKGAFPASVGGRLSSVIDVRMKEGNREEFHGEFSTGLLLGSFRLEGPIWRKKTSFHLSARRSLLDLLTTAIQVNGRNNLGISNLVTYHLADVSAKVNHEFSPQSRLYLSYYQGQDKFSNEDFGFNPAVGKDVQPDGLNRLDWGNRMLALRWTQVLSQRWFLQANAQFSRYRYRYLNGSRLPIDTLGAPRFLQSTLFSGSRIQDLGGKVSLDYYPNPNHHIQLGAGFIHHQYAPYLLRVLEEGDSVFNETPPPAAVQRSQAQEVYLFGQDQSTWAKDWRLEAGLRLTGFWVAGTPYLQAQPRLMLSWQPDARQQLSLAASQMVQFVHLLSTPGVGLPSDLWVPSSDRVRPQTAQHLNLGYAYRWERGYRLRLEAYGKYFRHLIDFQQDLSFQTIDPKDDWQASLAVGRGWAYGLETQLEKTAGPLRGWLAYTLAWTYRQFDAINQGEPFPFRLDRRHDLSLNFLYQRNERREYGLTWLYGSGAPATLGQERYPALGSNLPIILPGPRNGYRMEAYHRLDFSVSFHKQKKRGKRTWVLGAYNLYNRQNPFFLFFRPDALGRPELFQQSLLPLLPYFTYRFEF